MMNKQEKPLSATEQRKQLAAAFCGYLFFCLLSVIGQVQEYLLGLVVLYGIGLPIAYGWTTGKWAEAGFTRRKMRSAIVWGILAGILAGLIGIAVVPQRSIPDNILIQLGIGVPIWAFLVSPFQEFFFRGWLQAKLEQILQPVWGILTATICFTVWHYCASFVGRTAVPLDTPIGFVSTFGAGLVYAYVFHRTRNVLSPWLAHTITGIVFILIGTMDFSAAFMQV
jgi:membrane protease YdiL (CAAX protease family)